MEEHSQDETFQFSSSIRRQPSISSIVSDATASDLPGPGRNLGRLYDTLGDGLLSQIQKGMTRRGFGPGAVSRKVVMKQTMLSSDSIDTDATAPNLPGPGRTVGMFFDWLGGKLENQLGILMERRGYGPEATMAKILTMRGRWRTYREGERVYIRNNMEIQSEEHRKLLKYCQRLLKYTRSLVPKTQLQAFDRITDLATNDPYIRDLLGECLDRQEPRKYLPPDAYDGTLTLSSQKALVSLSSNSINSVTMQYERRLKEGTLNEQFLVEKFIPIMTKFLS
ncbi:hypothetical protein SCHPADRAFT_380623 [Schizopora paradoxa]|uniref:Uncharacterized protein n=1 Tax=Schizopora paradoxa TaxID=27342 RepID=A0A0H2RMH9_9AGAM|nr:hypothetical protein SCHPADRAFT_380623 [Schizopora paradoxa]